MVTEGVEDSWKQLSLEMLVTIAENAPAMMRKHAKFLPRIGKSVTRFGFKLHVHLYGSSSSIYDSFVVKIAKRLLRNDNLHV
jgi:hypothetical protein